MKTRKIKPMAVYWINLERSKERREHMLEILKDETFDTMSKHRVEAIDGKKMTEQKLRSMFTIDLTKYTIIEYCCLLSHIKALKQFSKSNSTLALILEDDVCLDYKPYWQKSIQDCIRDAPSDWEILQLSYLFQNKFPNKLYTPTKLHSGAHSYVVNKKGVLRFLKEFHLDGPIQSDYILYDQMKSYTYQYPFFTYTAKDSEIHADHIKKFHIPSKCKVEQFLSTRDFPLKQEMLFITAFKNINQDKWKDYRNIDKYLERFVTLTKLPYTLIVYVEPNIKKRISFFRNVIIRDLNEVDTFLERDKQISKINFVSHAKRMYPHYEFYSWVDFGFSFT